MSIPATSIHTGSYAIIPSYIMEDHELSEGAKILYARISMYSNEGRCWASNEHFAEKHNVKIRQIQRWIEQLRDKKYIIIDIEHLGLRQTNRTIWLSEDFKNKFKTCQKRHPPMSKKTPI